MNQIFRPPAPSVSLDVDVMRSVVAIAEAGSIAAAAIRVGRTPAAVSMQIKKLEDNLARTLFERTRQGMTPTAEGERLLDYARKMIELNRDALQAFSMPELEGEVSLGMTDSFGGERMAEVMAAFARSHPKVTVNATMSTSASMAPRLDSGELDIGILTPGCAVETREEDLILCDEALVWIAREGGRAARQRPVPLSMADEGCAWRMQALDALRGSRMATREAYVSDYDSAQMAAVKADLAVAPMPKSYLGPGFVALGERDGFPPLGRARIVLRLGHSASGAARALAARVAESYGRSMPD